MNRHEIVTEDRRLEAIQLAQRWAKQNLISDTSARHIAAAHSSRVRQQPLLLRGIQFVGVFVAGLAFMVAFTTIVEANFDEYSNDALKSTFFLCALAAVLVALTAIRRGYYTAGIDEGAWGVAIVSTALWLCSLTDFDNVNVFFGGLLIMAMVPAVFGYLLSSLIAWGSASWLILDWTGLRIFAIAQALFLIVLLATEPRFVWRRRARQIGSLVFVAGTSCLLACNTFLPFLLGLNTSTRWFEWQPLPEPVSLPVVVGLTAGFLITGLWRLDRRLVDIGLLSLVVVINTLARVVFGWSLEGAMIVVGSSLISGGLLVRWVLRRRDRGPTLTAPPVVVPRGWTVEDAKGAATWLKEVSSGIRKTRWSGARKPGPN